MKMFATTYNNTSSHVLKVVTVDVGQQFPQAR